MLGLEFSELKHFWCTEGFRSWVFGFRAIFVLRRVLGFRVSGLKGSGCRGFEFWVLLGNLEPCKSHGGWTGVPLFGFGD